eukprot:jgi/Psemu1/192809/e_gw1.132.23.1
MNGSIDGCKRATASAPLPDVQVFLSRPTYPLGGTVVGTILIQQKQQQPFRNGNGNGTSVAAATATATTTTTTTTPKPSLRSILESVTVYAAGFCKIDSRWHDYKSYTKIYGKEHPFIRQLQQGNNEGDGNEGRFDSDLLEQSEDTVCFWATNGMEALDLPERLAGRRWNNSETDFQRGLGGDDDDDDDDGNNKYKDKDKDKDNGDTIDASIHNDILAFTFRVDIPSDLPHSVYATTCRYFYTANILVKTATQQQILKRSFQVVTPASNSHSGEEDDHDDPTRTRARARTSARVKFGHCVGLAHSSGLPCHLSATEINRPKGQLVVVQNQCLVQQYQHNNDVQTLRVSNASGRPVCILTVIGSQTLSPGSRVHLQWDFPNEFEGPQTQKKNGNEKNNDNEKNNGDLNDNNNNSNNNPDEYWIPCHQVCACLQGEEYAVYEDGTKKRTQSFLFDTCHEWVEAGVTDRVSKTLWLNSSSGDGADGNSSHYEGGAPPCDLKTDVMEVSTWCRVDITVREREQETANANTNGGGYHNLTLRIPCKVRDGSSYSWKQEEQERMEQQVQPLDELLDIQTENTNTNTNTAAAFPVNDIRSDLKTLSLAMEQIVCGKQKRIIHQQ